MKKQFAEFIGTFSLVLFGCGAAIVSGISSTGPSGIGLLGISLAFGLAVVVMAYAIGPISGCHINPAITISMLVAGKIKTYACQGCHGIPGTKTAFPDLYSVPKLGGQHPQYIVSSLKADKAGQRTHSTMQANAAGLSDQDMEDIAAYYGAK